MADVLQILQWRTILLPSEYNMVGDYTGEITKENKET